MSGVNDCEVYENEEFYENEIFDSTAPDVPGETITLTFNKVGCVRQQDRLGEAKLTLQLVQRTVCQVGPNIRSLATQCRLSCCWDVQLKKKSCENVWCSITAVSLYFKNCKCRLDISFLTSLSVKILSCCR